MQECLSQVKSQRGRCSMKREGSGGIKAEREKMGQLHPKPLKWLQSLSAHTGTWKAQPCTLSLTPFLRDSHTSFFWDFFFCVLLPLPHLISVIWFPTWASGPPCFDNPFGPFFYFNYPQISTCTVQTAWSATLVGATATYASNLRTRVFC